MFTIIALITIYLFIQYYRRDVIKRGWRVIPNVFGLSYIFRYLSYVLLTVIFFIFILSLFDKIFINTFFAKYSYILAIIILIILIIFGNIRNSYRVIDKNGKNVNENTFFFFHYYFDILNLIVFLPLFLLFFIYMTYKKEEETISETKSKTKKN